MTFDFQLIIVGLSISLSIIIAFVVLLSDKTSDTNKIFFAFTLTTILWGIVNYLSSHLNFQDKQLALLLLRLNLFFGLWQAFYLFRLFLTFPHKKVKNKWWVSFIFFPLVILTSVLIFSSHVISEVTRFSNGHIIKASNGPGIILFGILSVGFVLFGITILFKKYLRYKNNLKKQVRLMLTGSFLMFSLIIIFNFILPNFWGNSSYVSIGAVYVIPFLVLTGYSIIKYHLFDIKIITTELITYALWIFILVRTLMAETFKERVINGVLFLIVVIVGLLLIKSVLREVKQREKLEEISKQLEGSKFRLEESNLKLEEVNEKLKGLDKLKTEFLSLASHQLRSPLTAIKGYASMVIDGDYGKINPKAKEIIERIMQSSNNLTLVVNDLLNVSKIESGGMKYERDNFDLAKIVEEEAKELSITAEKKGLKLNFIKDEKNHMVFGDKGKIQQVVLNLIDNSMKYTKKGKIEVSVLNTRKKIRFEVKDTGMGVSPEIKKTLFQKFNRGDGAKMNTSGSGLGLYLAKEIILAHKGEIGVDSEGVGKGSTFWFELDAIQPSS